MDIINADYMETFEKFQSTLKSTKYALAQLDVLSESIKLADPKEVEEPNINFVLSSLCTKWMQLNAGLGKLNCINTTANQNDVHNTTNGTANQLILYSILDEFKLNESQKPQSPCIDVDRKTGYIGLGFISHIANESQGTVYVLDVMSMPDPLVLYGSTPKPLGHAPTPGEMFAYVYQEKYLVRAVRLAFECRDQNSSTNQFGAMLIDIGCVVRIDVKPNYRDLYEVTQAAKIIPAYAKLCHLVQIPPKMCVHDLLHTRVHYKVLCNDGNQMFVNIVSGGINPFAVEQQKEWNFYMYFFGDNLNQVTPSKLNFDRQRNSNSLPITMPPPVPARVTATTPVKQNDNSLNPFANTSQYEIKSIAVTPLTDKENPFYDPNTNELVSTKPKFLNFQLTKILNNLSPEWIDKNLPQHSKPDGSKIVNQASPADEITMVRITNDTNGTKERKNTIDEVDKTSTKQNGFEEAPQMQSTPATTRKLNQTNVVSNQSKVCEPEKTVVPYMKQSNVAHPQIGKSNQRRHEIVHKSSTLNSLEDSIEEEWAFQHAKPTNGEPEEKMPPASQTNSIEPIQNKIKKKEKHTSTEYPQPKKLPAIGETVLILYEHMVSVEEFYAVLRFDPTRDMEVDEFSVMMNKEWNIQRLQQYNHKCKPKLFDKVIAMFENWYCRAKIIKVIDEHVFQVYYVDYGNCAKVKTLQLYKYDERLDKYPAYALHFRLNGVKEVNPWDNNSRQAIEQIMITECEATVVDIIHCDKMNRNTYVVDLRDENGLNVAETLISKNYALHTEHLANHATAERSHQNRN
ncbi:uncharacterized protein LOC129578647 [Sitodiplosis mosellana]|uniref:uncharacterized protein LOC129578647 n=1 Tax=Sitodiplosis mosellana TaxID=263140 RepID=UPI0024452F2B|nr:uncharacterized protein LOC129578647 [Sitodiplosis mosellana]